MQLFVYGTLMDPATVLQLLGRSIESRPATLHGYRRASIRRLPYPFAVADPGAHIDGCLLLDLSPSDMQRLDQYEGVSRGLFDRVEVTIMVDAQPQRAALYIGGAGLQRRLKNEL